MSNMLNGWNWTPKEAPADTPILVQAKGLDYHATYDPTWRGGAGAFFDRKNRIIADVWCWRSDVDAYLADRPQGPNVIPVR